jgi:hypothetical protein
VTVALARIRDTPYWRRLLSWLRVRRVTAHVLALDELRCRCSAEPRPEWEQVEHPRSGLVTYKRPAPTAMPGPGERVSR